MGESPAWCPQCGPGASVDEDGCCLNCGCDAWGAGTELAWRVVAMLRRVQMSGIRISDPDLTREVDALLREVE